MHRLLSLLLFSVAAIAFAGLLPTSAKAQTERDRKSCVNYTGNADSLIRGCSAFIRTGRSAHGKRIPRKEMWSFFTLRSIGYNVKGEYDLAIADLSRAIELNPKNADIFLQRGANHVAKGDLKQALADYTEASRLDAKRSFQKDGLNYWLRYLKEIQDAGDYANWSAPPLGTFHQPE